MTTPSEEEPRDYDQYVLWQLISLLRGLKVADYITPPRSTLVEEHAKLMAVTVRQDIATSIKTIRQQVIAEVRGSMPEMMRSNRQGDDAVSRFHIGVEIGFNSSVVKINKTLDEMEAE